MVLAGFKLVVVTLEHPTSGGHDGKFCASSVAMSICIAHV